MFFSDTVKVHAQFTIVSELTWSNSLLNKTTFIYKQTTVEIVEEVLCCVSRIDEMVAVLAT